VQARGSDFLNARTDVVSVGTTARVTDLADQHQENFTLLGAWDSDPEKGIISYLSPVAQALLNHGVGEEVEVPWEGSLRHYRIESIQLAAMTSGGAPQTPALPATSDTAPNHPGTSLPADAPQPPTAT
jgi:hypothetical protein